MGILDNIWRNSLTFTVVACSVLVTVSYAAPYSKYGRGCQDIGCLPSEVCVMSQDACSFGQRDGKDCGSYPTCKKQGAAGATNNRGQDTHNIAPSRPTMPPARPSPPVTQRPSAPAFPTYDDRDRIPQRPPSYPSYPSYPGGTNDYNNNNRGGSSGGFGGSGGYVPPGYDPIRDRPTGRPATTKKPGGGFFDSLQDRLGQEIGNYVKNAIFNQIVGGGGNNQGGGTSTRFGGGGGSPSGSGSSGFGSLFGGGGGSSGGSSGFGSLFGGGGGSSSGGSGGLSSLLFGGGGGGESQRRSGFGLFNENPSANQGGQVAQTRQQNYASQPLHHAGSTSDTTQRTTPKYGWNVQK